MALTTAPLLGFGASGAIGKTQVYASWKGRKYARRYVIPADPNTTAQQETRGVFTWGSNVWKLAPTLFQDPWNGYAKGKVMTGRNAWQGSAVKNLRTKTDLSDMVFSPGAAGGIAASAMTVTPGASSLTVAVTVPTPPTGWTLTEVVAAAILGQDPESGTDYTIVAGSDNSTPYSIDLTGLTAALYNVGVWPVWAKPDGSVAYGPSIVSTGTPT